MAVAFRSSQNVTNGTAGTTVVVSKPAGIVDTGPNSGRDHLIAFIASTSAPTHTQPAGWTLIANVNQGTVKLTVWRKLASSEGASWTWTLGSSQRNWGFVGAYTGVNPNDPVYDFSTDITLQAALILRPASTEGAGDVPELTTLPGFGLAVSAGTAVRTADGTATTWTTNATERSDVSTNGGSGTDISGVVGDIASTQDTTRTTDHLMQASQTQSAGAAIILTLRPYFTVYDGGLVPLVIEAAFGQDPDAGLAGATWTNITRFVVDSDDNPAVRITAGRADATSLADPTRITFTLLNTHGEFTHPNGIYTSNFVRNLPFRIRLTGFGSAPNGHHRGTAFLAEARVRWDDTLRVSVIDVVAAGRLRRLQRNTPPLHSCGYRTILQPVPGTFPVEYWPFEGTGTAKSALSGHAPAQITGANLASSSVIPGSDSLPVLTATGAMIANVAPYTDTDNMWSVVYSFSLPSEPAGPVTLLQVYTTGTAAVWNVGITPGTTVGSLNVFTSAGASLLSTSTAAIDESRFYGQPAMLHLQAKKSGADIVYQMTMFWDSGANGVTSFAAAGSITGATQGIVVGAITAAQPNLNGTTVGHLALYKVETVNNSAGLTISVALLRALAQGEPAANRFSRLCAEEGVPAVLQQQPQHFDVVMGPQRIASLIELLRECEAVEGCLMHDNGVSSTDTGLLFFPAADIKHNVETQLTLNFNAGHIALSFEPTLDDLDAVNDVEAQTSGGGFARVLDQEAIDIEGDAKTQISVNLLDDTFLDDIAGREVALGTAPGMRYGSTGFNLRASPELAQQWLWSQLSSKLDIVNPPSQYPPDTIESFIEGYTETIGLTSWTVQCNLSPASPWRAQRLADTSGDMSVFAGYLDADSAILHSAENTTDTLMVVDCYPNCTTTADDLPFDVFVGSERVTVTASSLIFDSFTRTVSNDWGSTSTGSLPWTTDGGSASDFSTDGTTGKQSLGSVATYRSCILDAGGVDFDFTADVSLPVASASGASITQNLCGRFTDINNHYAATLFLTTGGSVQLQILKRVGGTLTGISSTVTLGTGHAANDLWRMRFQGQGATLNAKAWLASTSEPAPWQVSAADSSLTTGSQMALRSRLETGNTNTLPVVVTWDNVTLTSSYQWTVTRSVNGLVASHTPGEDVTLIPALRLVI